MESRELTLLRTIHRQRFLVHSCFFLLIVFGFGEIFSVDAKEVFKKHQLSLSTGIQMTYIESGNSEGEAVIFLHGYTDTKRSFYPMIEHLSRLRPDLRLIVIDQRGHGESSMPSTKNCSSAPERCFRPSDFAMDLLAFLDQKKIARAHLIGHSMGSIVAQEVALTKPERVVRLVLIGSTASFKGNPVVRDFLLADLIEGPWKKALQRKGYNFPDDVYALTPLDADPEVKKWMSKNWVVDPAADPEFIAYILPETCRIRIGTWLGVARSLLEIDNRERLKDLRVPVMVIWATQDNAFPEPDQVLLRNSLDVAALRLRTPYFWKQYGKRPLPASGVQENDIGHNVQWGAPAAVAVDVASFLAPKGAPTRDLFYAASTNTREILTSAGEAIVIEGPKEK